MIEHEGVIEHIDGNKISVKIIQKTACSECHAKGYCSASDSSVKSVQIKNANGNYQLNERVMIHGKNSMGRTAVFLAYVLPLFLIIGTIVVSQSLYKTNDLQSAGIGLLILIPYYAVLYLLRNKLASKFVFSISKIK